MEMKIFWLKPMQGNCCYTENCFQPYIYLLSCHVSQYCLLFLQLSICQVFFHLFFYTSLTEFIFLTFSLLLSNLLLSLIKVSRRPKA